MSIKIRPKVVVGYFLIYFMLIWNQTNLGETFLKKFSLPILCVFVCWVFIKSKKLTKWCGLLSVILMLSAVLIRLSVGGIGIIAIVSMLSSVYIVAIAVIYNKESILDRVLKMIVFLASMSLFLWLLCMFVPQIYESLIPQYNSLMTYRIYSDAENYKEIHYVCRGLFLYTFREVDRMKNSGIFTEPGIYQMVLNIGIFIILFMNEYVSCKRIKLKLAILVLTLCTTQSTTGFVGLSLIVFFYLFINSKEQKVYSKQKVLLYMSALVILLLLDFQIRGENSIFQIAIIDKLFSKGTISLVDNASSAARVGTILLTTASILKHPFGIGYTNLEIMLNTEKTGFVAAELLRFGAVWGIIPLCFVLWWIFSPLNRRLNKSMIIIYILLYINTLLAQSNMFYPILILIPIAFKYNYQRYENRNVNRKEIGGLNENIMDL